MFMTRTRSIFIIVIVFVSFHSRRNKESRSLVVLFSIVTTSQVMFIRLHSVSVRCKTANFIVENCNFVLGPFISHFNEWIIIKQRQRVVVCPFISVVYTNYCGDAVDFLSTIERVRDNQQFIFWFIFINSIRCRAPSSVLSMTRIDFRFSMTRTS